MGGADDAHVDRLLGSGADLAHPPLLDRAQQLDLHRQRQVGHLVEHQGAAVGRLEKTIALVGGAGKRALAVAEKLGLHQRLRNRTAVHRDKRARRARALGVDFARRQFLAAARFARDGDRRHRARQPADLRAQRLHCRRVADQPACRGGARRRLAPTLVRQPQRRAHHHPQVVQHHRLGDVVERAGLERHHRVVGAAVGGDDGDRRALAACRHLAHQLQAKAVRQAHVGQHQRVLVGRPQGPGLAERLGAVDVEPHPHQRDVEQFAQVGFVVDDEDTG